jgi:hypothetical protein
VSDPDSTRPRLVSVGEGTGRESAEPAAAEAPEPASGPAPRRLLWLLVVLSIALLAGLVVQTLRAGSLREANEALSGELFATRAALDAYVDRFAEIRESIGGLQLQLQQLDALVSADPLAPAPAPEPGSEPEPVPDAGN